MQNLCGGLEDFDPFLNIEGLVDHPNKHVYKSQLSATAYVAVAPQPSTCCATFPDSFCTPVRTHKSGLPSISGSGHCVLDGFQSHLTTTAYAIKAA